MRAVTHNIVHTLNVEDTNRAVQRALMTHPQIVSFQEFDPGDDIALRRVGMFLDTRFPNEGSTKKEYLICRDHAKGLPILLRRPYVHRIHSIQSLTVVKAKRGVRVTPATEVLFTNRHEDKVAVLNTHPLAHHDEKGNREAFEKAARWLPDWAEKRKNQGYIPMIMMDGNGLKQVPGLVSCWFGHKELPTGPGGQTIDVICTLACAESVSTFGTPSDHDGVVATYVTL